jgi:hemolysin activation/secretion protein
MLKSFLAHILAAAVLLLTSLPGEALAQTTPLIIDQNRADRAASLPPPMDPPLRGPIAPAAPSIQAFVLSEVRIEGASLPPAVIEAATRPFISKTMDRAAIQRLTDALSAAYARSDIALYTIMAPGQDFAGGVLYLRIAEGSIASLDVKDARGRDTSLIARYGERLKQERPLTRTTLQRYVSLIRDIPGLSAELQLLQTVTPGEVTLSAAPKQKRLEVALTLNNSGSSLLGRYQAQADVTVYGLRREGEATRLTFIVPADLARFQYYALSHSEPLGSDGTVLTLGGGLLKTHPKDLPIRGEADTLQLQVSHPVLRRFDENLYATGGIDGLNSSNAVIGQTVSNERVRVLRGSLAYARTKPKSALSLSAIVSLGLDGLGAQESNPMIAAADFFKFNIVAAYTRQLGEAWFLRLSAAGQYGANLLPASEFAAYGGLAFGRAFAAAAISGDSGAAGSAEIGWRPGGLGRRFDGSEVYAFADRERSWLRHRIGPGRIFDLASAGAGVRIAVDAKTALQLEAARVLDAPAPVAAIGAWRFGMALTSRY